MHLEGRLGALGGPGPRILQIHEISAALPPICSLNLKKQQAKWMERCPKVLWHNLQKVLVLNQKLPSESYAKVSEK
jgi:hypothetical protein